MVTLQRIKTLWCVPVWMLLASCFGMVSAKVSCPREMDPEYIIQSTKLASKTESELLSDLNSEINKFQFTLSNPSVMNALDQATVKGVAESEDSCQMMSFKKTSSMMWKAMKSSRNSKKREQLDGMVAKLRPSLVVTLEHAFNNTAIRTKLIKKLTSRKPSILKMMMRKHEKRALLNALIAWDTDEAMDAKHRLYRRDDDAKESTKKRVSFMVDTKSSMSESALDMVSESSPQRTKRKKLISNIFAVMGYLSLLVLIGFVISGIAFSSAVFFGIGWGLFIVSLVCLTVSGLTHEGNMEDSTWQYHYSHNPFFFPMTIPPHSRHPNGI